MKPYSRIGEVHRSACRIQTLCPVSAPMSGCAARPLLPPKVLLREVDEDAALQAVSAMQRGHLVDLTPQRAMSAAALSLQHSLPMADSIMLAAAREHEATLWTQDEDFKGLDNVKYFSKK